MTEFKAHFKSVQPDLGGSLPGNLIFGLPGKDGGYYLVAAEQVDANTIRFTFTPSQKEMPAVDPVDITLPNATGAGLTTAQINALDGMFKVCAFTKPDVSAEYNAFKTAFGIGGGEEPDVPDVPDVPDEPDVPEKTLTSISAVYSGGSVTAGTAVNDLTGIVVTAHYSDGTSETVTGYTLSGTIAEGSNTITVSYGGKTTTFTVTGVAESGGDEPETGVSNETTWTDGVPYTFEQINGEYTDRNTGEIKTYAGWWRSPYLYCAGASAIRGIVKLQSPQFSSTKDNAFYDADRNFIVPIQPFSFDSLANQEVGAHYDIPVPENAVYCMVSASNTLWHNPATGLERDIEYVPIGFGSGEEPDVPDAPDEPDEPEKTLTSISAVYSGGSVTAGTAVNDLTGIVVTAHYSDGTSETITGYTMSGTIAEGSNIITVSYGGKTTTFTVTGTAESGGDEPETGVSNETTWTDGVTYTFDWVENEYVSDGDGVFNKYEGWNRSPMLYCAGASRIDFVGANSQQANYNALYDADKQYVQDFRPSANGYIDIPEGAVYFAVSGPSAVTQNFTATPRA